MRFIVDAQLPPALARFLAAKRHQADHDILAALQRSETRIEAT